MLKLSTNSFDLPLCLNQYGILHTLSTHFLVPLMCLVTMTMDDRSEAQPIRVLSWPVRLIPKLYRQLSEEPKKMRR
jgi:hypothetical protein